MPVVGQRYQAKNLPPGAVCLTSTNTEYVKCRRIECVMRWEQPIPGSGEWLVTYVGQLPEGEWMTEREKQEVEEARVRMDAYRAARR